VLFSFGLVCCVVCRFGLWCVGFFSDVCFVCGFVCCVFVFVCVFLVCCVVCVFCGWLFLVLLFVFVVCVCVLFCCWFVGEFWCVVVLVCFVV
jgi:hypothetical protein